MKMSVDETGRDETAFGFDLFIHRLGILFADILDLIAIEHDNAVFNNFVLPAVEADDITALYESSHCLAFQVLNSNRGRTNKRNHSRQVLLEIATIGRAKPVQQQKGKCEAIHLPLSRKTGKEFSNPSSVDRMANDAGWCFLLVLLKRHAVVFHEMKTTPVKVTLRRDK